MAKEYIIYCDESVDYGRYFSNFYGGVLVRSENFDEITHILENKKIQLNFRQEIKWQRVTENYQSKYKDLIDKFFDLVEQDLIKTRIMFTQNIHIVNGVDLYHRENKYFLLYYQFIKHAFGLRFAPAASVRIYFDKLPDTSEKAGQFKDYIKGLENNPQFRKAGIKIIRNEVTDVDSSDHVLLQCIDVVLGAIQFRLNNKHLEKPKGQTRRGKRTIAKEKLYKHINLRIRRIHPNFNIGISTGLKGRIESYWEYPYRHWLFVPQMAQVDMTKGKKREAKK